MQLIRSFRIGALVGAVGAAAVAFVAVVPASALGIRRWAPVPLGSGHLDLAAILHLLWL